MIKVAAAVCIVNGQVLLASRPADKPPAGWEFPGGKLEPGESVQQAAVRELKEELDFDVIPMDMIYVLKKPEITLYFIRVIPAGTSSPSPRENQQIQWQPLSGNTPAGLLKNDSEFWKFITAG